MTTVKRKAKQLGQILIEQGLITPTQLEQALEEHRKTPKSLGRVLIDLQLIKEADLVRALAEQVGLEFVDGKLLVAMSDPANVYALDDIRTITNRDVQPVVATAADVEQAIQKFAGMDGQVEALASQASEQLEGDDEQRNSDSEPRQCDHARGDRPTHADGAGRDGPPFDYLDARD